MQSLQLVPHLHPTAVAIRFRSAGTCAVLAAAAVLFGANLGDRAVVSEELRWAEVAREMRASGDYLHPTINGHTYFDKPVGSYWPIVAASYLTGGVDETAARLPAAVAAWVGVLLTILLGRRLYDDRTAVLAGAILATSFAFVFYARRATADAETVTGVLFAVWLYDRGRDSASTRWVLGLWAAMAVTSLTKGLLGFALPLAVIGVHGTWAGLAEGRGLIAGNRWFFNRWTPVGVVVAVAIYFVPFVLASNGSGLSDGLAMVWRENVKRFVNPHNHVGPVYLYAAAIWALLAPWSAFLPAALWPTRGPAAIGDRFARAYFWAVFLFFTVSASRRNYYLLPILPAAALLVARVLLAPPSLLRRIGWVVFGVGIVGAGAVLIPPAWVLPEPLAQLPPLPERGLFACGWIASLIAFAWASLHRPQALPFVAVSIAAAGFTFAFTLALPAVDGERTRRSFAAEVRRRTDDQPEKLALYRARDVVFDLGRTADDFAEPGAVADALRSGRVRWVLARRRYLAGVEWPAAIVLEETVRPWDGPDQLGDKLLLLEAAAARP